MHKDEHAAIVDEIEFFRARRQEEMVHTQHGLDSLQAQMNDNEQLVHECLSQIKTMSEDVSKRLSSHKFRMSWRLRAIDSSTYEIAEAVEHLQEGHLENSFTLFQ